MQEKSSVSTPNEHGVVVRALEFLLSKMKSGECIVEDKMVMPFIGGIMPKTKTDTAWRFLDYPSKNALYQAMHRRGIKAKDGYLSWQQMEDLRKYK